MLPQCRDDAPAEDEAPACRPAQLESLAVKNRQALAALQVYRHRLRDAETRLGSSQRKATALAALVAATDRAWASFEADIGASVSALGGRLPKDVSGAIREATDSILASSGGGSKRHGGKAKRRAGEGAAAPVARADQLLAPRPQEILAFADHQLAADAVPFPFGMPVRRIAQCLRRLGRTGHVRARL